MFTKFKKYFLIPVFLFIALTVMPSIASESLLWPLQVGERWEYLVTDSKGGTWTDYLDVMAEVTIDSEDYYQIREVGMSDAYLRSTDNAIYGWDEGQPVTFHIGVSGIYGNREITYMGIESLTVPYGGPYVAHVFKNRDLSGGTPSPYWYDYFVPDVGYVKMVDYWSDNSPEIWELVQISIAPRMAQFFVQHRIYEDGREFNRIWFQLKDEADNRILEDVADDVQLIDPNGEQVPINDLVFEKNRWSYPRYDGNTGQWIYYFEPDGELFHHEAEYYGVVPDPLIEGEYRLLVTDIYGNQYESHFWFNTHYDLPIIRSSSFKYKFDKDGNLIWKWKVPYKFNPSFETSIRAIIQTFNHEGFHSFLWTKVPTHLERLFVPNYVMDKIREEGDKYKLIIQLRTNDQNSRTYSKARKLKFHKHQKKGHKHPKH